MFSFFVARFSLLPKIVSSVTLLGNDAGHEHAKEVDANSCGGKACPKIADGIPGPKAFYRLRHGLWKGGGNAKDNRVDEHSMPVCMNNAAQCGQVFRHCHQIGRCDTDAISVVTGA